MLKKIKKSPMDHIVGRLDDNAKYVVTKDGRVFRELKPTIVGNRHYYNVVIDGVLRRISRNNLKEEASNV
jgi:hypothetical protein